MLHEPGRDGDEVGFEEIYARACGDFAAVPWVTLEAHPVLLAWLDEQPTASGPRALVVGCGLGDDAEELAARGWVVTAFDLSTTAIAWCQRRFPDSAVDYQVQDLFALPDAWKGWFDLVVEINTLQSLPPSTRVAATGAIAATIRPGGCLFVRCLAGRDEHAVGSRPWPVSRAELGGFVAAGLLEREVRDDIPGRAGHRCFRALYEQPTGASHGGSS